MKLQITLSYLQTCSTGRYQNSIDWLSNKNESVIEWVENYSKRNKIKSKIVDYVYRDGSTEEQIELEFKSNPQYQAFLRIGNKNFPYFEFI